MKKIVTSIGMIVFAAAIVAGGTGAFFSDTETSTGNVFTAGALDLKIDSVSHYNGMVCTLVDEEYVWIPDGDVTLGVDMQPSADENMDSQEEWDDYNDANPLQYPKAGTECTGTWPLDDLGEGEVSVGTFFNFDDVKPGDEGENTISIHVDYNDAWMCVSLDNVDGADLSESATEPEDEAEDALGDIDHGDTLADSELDENLHFYAWIDDGDNIFEENEVPLGGASADELAEQTWALADSTTGDGPIPGAVTSYIGVYWCAGEIEVNGTSLSCDGEEMGNEAQTDSWSADLVFYVEQARNNAEFTCNRPTGPTTGAITVDKVVGWSDEAIDGVTIGDFTLTIDGPGDPIVVTDEVEVANLLPGTYTVSEVYSGVPANVTYDAQFSGACTDNGTTGTVELVAGADVTCTITNVVSLIE